MYLTEKEIKTILDSKMSQFRDDYGKTAMIDLLTILNLNDQLRYREENRIIPLPDWNKYHDRPTVSAIRNYIAQNKIKPNGIEETLERGEKLIRINEQKFLNWYNKK